MCVSSVQSQTIFIFVHDLILALRAVYYCSIKGKGSSLQKGKPRTVCKNAGVLFFCFVLFILNHHSFLYLG